MANVALVSELIARGESVYILTKAASESAKLGKLDWVRKHIPEFNLDRVIVIVGNGKKTDYMATADGILIDDDIKNTRQWEKAGHTAITLEFKGQTVVL
jgi:hypothetical protein